MKKIQLDSDIIVIEDFLSAQDCNKYIEKAELQGFEEAKINAFGRQVMNKSVRNNDRHIFFDETLAIKLWNQVKAFIPERIGTYNALGLNEMFRIYRYQKEQQFKMHRDGSYYRNMEECSFLSFLIYLNADFTGGETEFRNITTVIPKQGDALIFKHPVLHEGKTIITGTKYVLRTDVMYKLNEK